MENAKEDIDFKKIITNLNRMSYQEVTLTRDIGMHNFYIKYVRGKNSNSKRIIILRYYRKLDYCIERHRGLIGNAKLISISNLKETYFD